MEGGGIRKFEIRAKVKAELGILGGRRKRIWPVAGRTRVTRVGV